MNQENSAKRQQIASHHSKKFWLLGAAVVVLVSLTIMAGVAFAVGFPHVSKTSTVDGTSYTGSGDLTWSINPLGLVYTGISRTQSQAVIDKIQVTSEGCEYCGPIQFDIDWRVTNSSTPGWLTGYLGEGWALLGECSWWFPQPNEVLAVDSHHEAWEDGDYDDISTSAWEMMP